MVGHSWYVLGVLMALLGGITYVWRAYGLPPSMAEWAVAQWAYDEPAGGCGFVHVECD